MIYKFKCFFCKKEIKVEGEFRGEIIKCPECHKELAIPKSAIDEDEKTGYDEEKEEEEQEEAQKKIIKTRYPALFIISNILVAIAFIFLIAVIACFFAIFSQFNEDIRPILILSAIVCLAFFIILLAFSELIKLFIDIEKNTRFYKKLKK